MQQANQFTGRFGCFRAWESGEWSNSTRMDGLLSGRIESGAATFLRLLLTDVPL